MSQSRWKYHRNGAQLQRGAPALWQMTKLCPVTMIAYRLDVKHYLGEQFDKRDHQHSSDALFIVLAYHLVEVELNCQRNAVGTSVIISHRVERMSVDEDRGPRSRILIVVGQPKVEP